MDFKSSVLLMNQNVNWLNLRHDHYLKFITFMTPSLLFYSWRATLFCFAWNKSLYFEKLKETKAKKVQPSRSVISLLLCLKLSTFYEALFPSRGSMWTQWRITRTWESILGTTNWSGVLAVILSVKKVLLSKEDPVKSWRGCLMSLWSLVPPCLLWCAGAADWGWQTQTV